ncbi:MAG TPA: hypothetical protein DEP72_01100 [Clostridiales bacterium]|nr:MAG: hypothetical protein A2Y18_01865 [Clostridiales bacterium GWD2_32_19]HCC06750.1 hypothetical protein [Clostridiales bacterium]
MNELAFDIFVGILILSTIVVVVNLFDSNLKIINTSTNDKNTEISQINDEQVTNEHSLYYTGADVLAYINDSKTSTTIYIKYSESLIYKIDNINRQIDIQNASSYIKVNNYLTDKYSFDRVSYTFLKT